MHYLQGHFDLSLGKVISYLVPEHQYKSVHDLFNPTLFHSALMAILQNIPDLSGHLDTISMTASMQYAEELQNPSGFVQLRIKNFNGIWHAMQMALGYQNQEVGEMNKQNLFKMVKNYDLDILQIFIEHLFELLIKNHEALEYITEMEAEDQTSIKDFLQRAKDKAEVHKLQTVAKEHQEDQRKKLEEQNMEYRHLILNKESQIQKLTLQKIELEEQMQEMRQFEMVKEGQIDTLKKRLMAYEQTDTLFQQKDEQIHKLNKNVTDLQLTNRLLNSDLTAQKIKYQSKISELQQINGEYQVKIDKLSNTIEVISRQKEEIEISNKKVISNLKDKLKSQSDKMFQFQNQLVEAKISRQLRQREFSELWNNYQSLKQQSINESVSKITTTQRVKRFSSGQIQGGLVTSGHHKEFLRLGQQINQLQKLHQSAFEQQIMMFESGQDNLKKVQQIINENNRLKDKLSALDSKDYRAVVQENDKLKKRMIVMKKRNQELQIQKKEELDLMVSAFQQCLRSKS